MTRMEKLIQGLKICAKYSDWPEAQHDVVCGAPPGEITDPQDIQKLKELGWDESEEYGWYMFT